MTDVGDLALVRLGPEHAAGGVALSAEAGWNQTEADWRLMLGRGHGVGFVSPHGRLVASALVLPYGARFAWLSMVLVSVPWRRRGLASRLTQECLRHTAERELAVLLDAAPLAEAIYRPLGFEPVFGFRRWHAERPISPEPPADDVRPMRADDLGWVAQLDEKVFGSARPDLLAHLFAHGGDRAMVAQERGFVLARDGRLETQIGPLAAEDAGTAGALLGRAIGAGGGPLCLDLPERHEILSALLERAGFAPGRRFQRMRLGTREAFGDAARYFVVTGPELG